jgi:transposase
MFNEYGIVPDLCSACRRDDADIDRHGGDPESKGIVEHLVGYATRDVPAPDGDGVDLAVWIRAAAAWCVEVTGGRRPRR